MSILFDAIVYSNLYKSVQAINQARVRKIYRVVGKQEPLSEEDGDLYYAIREKIKTLKHTILFLLYILYEDDNHLSFMEKWVLRREFRKLKGVLTKEDKAEISLFLKSKPTLEYLVSYAKTQKLEFEDIEKLLLQLSLIIEQDSKYMPIIEHMRKRFIQHKEELKKE